MDTNLQLRFELNNLVDQWVDNVVKENGISYAMMEDALNATLVRIKSEVFKEYMSAVQQAAMAQQQQQQPVFFTDDAPEEEVEASE
jgi:hypothetical protein